MARDPKQVTQTQAAKHLGMSLSNYRVLAETSDIPKPGPGIGLTEIRLAALAHYRNKAARWSNPQGKDSKQTRSLQDERARVARAQADKLEIELSLAKGDSVSVTDQLLLLGEQDEALRVRLKALGVRLCQQLASETDPEAVCEVLDAAVRAAMQGVIGASDQDESEAAA